MAIRRTLIVAIVKNIHDPKRSYEYLKVKKKPSYKLTNFQ